MTDGTWSIPSDIRRKIARWVLELRASLEDDFRRQLVALGIRDSGIQPLPENRAVADSDRRAREVACAIIQRDVEAGSNHTEALEAYIRESAFTFLNRAFGLRCLDERGLLLVDGQRETAVKIDPASQASSLYWRVRNELPSATNPREVWRETLQRAGTAISERIRVVFDPDSEYAALLPTLPTLQKLVEGLNTPEIPSEVYAEDELLGWVYQYYQKEDKDAAYARLARGKKLERPEELAAASCLYTERYMVDYLLQNTLGTIWVEMHPNSKLPANWPYFVKPPLPVGEDGGEGAADETETPSPSTLDPSPSAKRLRNVTLLDPACGSGHFLVRAFDLLADMYREEGREPESEIPQLILERNLHGIDIDARSVQLAALALYLKGCELAGPSFRPRRLNLVAADAVLTGDEPPVEYLAPFEGDRGEKALVKSIWQGLKNVREFGSLLHPERAVDQAIEGFRERERGMLFAQGDEAWQRWKAELLSGLREEFERQAQSEDLGQRLFGEEAAKGVSLVEALGRRYDVVVTNPPYAGSGNLNDRVKKFVELEYKDGKRDLYAAFIQRCRDFCFPGGYVGMVTQQSWLFIRSFAHLRKEVLERACLLTLAHLGPQAFEEISGAVVNVALVTLRQQRPSPEHRVDACRLVALSGADQKAETIASLASSSGHVLRYSTLQRRFLDLPLYPLVYWLSDRFLETLAGGCHVGDIASVKKGLDTADNERFVRYVWEAHPDNRRWFLFPKGGGYRKWHGLNQYVVDWEDHGRRIKGLRRGTPRNEEHYGRLGLTYTEFGCGALGVRLLPEGAIFNTSSPGIFAESRANLLALAACLNTGVSSYLLRALQPGAQHLGEGYVALLPMPRQLLEDSLISILTEHCFRLKRSLCRLTPTEVDFIRCDLEASGDMIGAITQSWGTAALLHTLEELIAQRVLLGMHLGSGECEAVSGEVGIPAGAYPLLSGYEQVPQGPNGAELGTIVHDLLRAHPVTVPTPDELARISNYVRATNAATGSQRVNEELSRESFTAEDEDGALAQQPLPTETLIEDTARQVGFHPITVYGLLCELWERERLVNQQFSKPASEDYASVTILRLLGYRWPEQDEYEAEHGPILDPDLVDEDGIIPLVTCADQPTAEQRVRMRMERQFGEDGAEQSLGEFRQWVGRDLGDWLRRDFFKRDVQQFKQRPIAWHLVSREGTFQAFVLYHKLSRETLQKLRAQYAGGVIARLRGEQEKARRRDAAAEVGKLQLQIEDVEELRERLEKIERGDELKYRIRCRWKDETAEGRPGPYAPDIDDGVKVNIRPFQEAGLLAVREVIKKW